MKEVLLLNGNARLKTKAILFIQFSCVAAYLVTLGTFAHCKVDATESAIAVGDLLTSSNNPGHAKKATNPQIGSIIGKALEPLNEGTGYIAVFVNIQ